MLPHQAGNWKTKDTIWGDPNNEMLHGHESSRRILGVYRLALRKLFRA